MLDGSASGVFNLLGGVFTAQGDSSLTTLVLDAIEMNIYDGVFDLSGGQVQTKGDAVLNIIGDSASIDMGALNSGSNAALAGTYNFEFDALGVSAIDVAGFVNLNEATVTVDGSSYEGFGGSYVLFSSSNLLNAPVSATASNFDDFTATFSVVDDNYVLNLVPTSYDLINAGIRALGDPAAAPVLNSAPNIYTDDILPGTAASISPTNARQSIYYDALDYEGNPTRVFAIVDVPDSATAGAPVPAVVLVHGGGGTAFSDWVDLWVAAGYAAISIAVEGQTDSKDGSTGSQINTGWNQHALPGPVRDGIYNDVASTALSDQWMYHAVADTILAHSLLSSFDFVNSEQIGIMGVSWGGVITTTVVGIDDRFAFAIPVYGCGHKFDSLNPLYSGNLSSNEFYKNAWDPFLRIDEADLPILWYSYPQEWNFPLYNQTLTYTKNPNVRMVSYPNNMGHGHAVAWNRPESYAFADSVIANGSAWAQQVSINTVANMLSVTFESSKTLDAADLIYTMDIPATRYPQPRPDPFPDYWTVSAATVTDLGANQYRVDATIPAGATAYVINAYTDDTTPIVISSDFQSPLLSDDDDLDGLDNLREIAILGTDPDDIDSDGDGLSDGDEDSNGTNPLFDDSAVINLVLKLTSGATPAIQLTPNGNDFDLTIQLEETSVLGSFTTSDLTLSNVSMDDINDTVTFTVDGSADRKFVRVVGQ